MVTSTFINNNFFIVLVESDDSMSFTRQQLHEMIRESPQRLLDIKLQELDTKLLAFTHCPAEKTNQLLSILKNFKNVYKRKWMACNSTETRFRQKNDEWLQETVVLPSGPDPALPGNSKPGRPKKEFAELSERTKRHRTKEIRETASLEELTFAAQMVQRSSGNNEAAKVIRDITETPTRAKKFRKAAEAGLKCTVKKRTPEEALLLIVEGNLTTEQYELLYQDNKDIGRYPCYTYVQRAKQACYPPKQVTEMGAEVKIQDLVDHTSSRLCKFLEPVLEQFVQDGQTDFELIYKWGCDGSKQKEYKQKFNSENASDANLFVSSLVPLRLVCGKKVVWQNPRPSSPRFCRPIRMRYIKETKDVTNEEIKYIEDQAKNLQVTKIGENVTVKHTLLLTMVDGKVCNAATETTSTSRCYICKKTSKEFNDLSSFKEEDPETFKFGLSILHARIRFFESLLHLGYKVKADIKKGRVSKIDKEVIESQVKKTMQQDFQERMGLIVDVPKPGFGNSNDGNTSRRFFHNPEEVAEITGLDLELIKRFKIILEVLSSGHCIDLEKFKILTSETAELYVKLYPWQPMSPTVHKILTHSISVIQNALLPIGQLSEEAAESRNKHIKLYREHFSRKFSRIECNEDVFNRLLLTSDPYLSSLKPKKKSLNCFSKEALEYFIVEELE